MIQNLSGSMSLRNCFTENHQKIGRNIIVFTYILVPDLFLLGFARFMLSIYWIFINSRCSSPYSRKVFYFVFLVSGCQIVSTSWESSGIVSKFETIYFTIYVFTALSTREYYLSDCFTHSMSICHQLKKEMDLYCSNM